MDAEYFRMLFTYNRWANERVLDVAEKLTPEQYNQSVAGLSFRGSFADVMGHQLGTELVWLERWQGESPPTMASGEDFPTLESLRQRWAELYAGQEQFIGGLGDDDVGRMVTYRTMSGATFTQPLAHMLAHVVNHGTQFRAEAAVALTSFGASPGDLDLIFYLRALKSA